MTSLEYLHKNLHQLRMSRLMDDLRFRELYEEAKMHEKHANLTNLVSRSKNDKLSQETSFFLILTRMLAELQENEENEINSSNLDKVYKWYLMNKRTSKNTNQKPVKLNLSVPTANTKIELQHETTNEQMVNNNSLLKTNISTSSRQANLSSRIGLQHNLDDLNPNGLNVNNNIIISSRKSSRAISPVHFPNVNKNLQANYAINQSNSVLTKENKFLKVIEPTKSPEKLPELVAKDNSLESQSLSRLSATILSIKHENNDLNKPVEKKREFNDKTRIGILKALSNYADKLYTELDKKDTKKLESNLKSLSRFYYAFSESENNFSNINKKVLNQSRSPLTLNSLVELAKEVSDKMIISKAEASIRLSQNKIWFENSKRQQIESAQMRSTIEGTNKGITTEQIDHMIKSSSETFKLPVYSVVIKKSSRRPKSSSFNDWRGHISRPNTPRSRIKSALKHAPSRAKSTPNPKSYRQLNPSEISDNDTEKFESESFKYKPKRSTLKSSKASRSTESLSVENKEVKFISFIKKIEDTNNVEVFKPKLESVSKTDLKSDKTDSYIELPNQKYDEKSPIMESASVLQVEQPQEVVVSKEPTQISIQDIDMLKCLHNEIILCECCINPSVTPSSHIKSNDIFHLTSTNEDQPLKRFNEYHHDERTNNTALESEQKTDLREILLNNYDPRFAAKIGIRDFLPIEVMNNHLDEDSKPLEFIPFESIDQSYPKVQGLHVFDPNYNKPIKRLYRTNPSIPRPESKYGTRSGVYEQILNYKKQNLDSNALALVWQPEDVILVRDLLEMENEPLTELLKVESLRAPGEENEAKSSEIAKVHINVNMTPSGRPVNSQPHVRWKQLEMIPVPDEKVELASIGESNWNPEEKHYNSVENSKIAFTSRESLNNPDTDSLKQNIVKFRLKGSAVSSHRAPNFLAEIQSPENDNLDKKDESKNIYNEAKKSVHIPSIFKGTTVQNYVKEFNLEERARKEKQRLAAIKIQKTFRKHIRNKRFIEQSPPISSEKVEWNRHFANDMEKRKVQKDISLRNQEKILVKENLKLKNTLKHVGMHVDLYEVLFTKGPEYTNKILNKAATCIQKWVKGWLVRKEINKLKDMVMNDRITTWSLFLKHYRKTIKRILLIRGDNKTKFDFKIRDVMDFYLKEKRYNSYFDKLAFQEHIDIVDFEKMFKFADLYPSSAELKESKDNVLKFYKKKNNITSFPKNIVLDIIYYIYPPLATKLKSTRKSTWTNPRVGDDDALRLRGFKFIEQPNFENTWQLVAQATINQANKESNNKNGGDSSPEK